MFELIPFERRNSGLFNLFDHLDDDFFNVNESGFAPCRTDIRDIGDKYVLEAELPGFKKEEIAIDIDKDCLTISATHKEENNADGGSKVEAPYIRRERRMASLTRSFDVSTIDTNSISAKYENGVLTMELPKKSAQKPQTKQIVIE